MEKSSITTALFHFKGFEERISLYEKLYSKGCGSLSVQSYIILYFLLFLIYFVNEFLILKIVYKKEWGQ